MNVFQYCNNIKEWPYDKAVHLLTEWYLISRDWEEADGRYTQVSNSIRNQIRGLIKEGIERGKITGDISREDEEIDGEWCYHIDYDACTLSQKSLYNFITYKLDKKEFAAPEKFIAMLKGDAVNEDVKLTVHQQTKQMVQAVARTLWDMYPQMKTEEMKQHKAILEYAGGKNYPGKNTLSDWLREVDPRPQESKSGPKNKGKAAP